MKKKILILFVLLFTLSSYSYSGELFFKLRENQYPNFTIREQMYQLDELVEISASNFEFHAKSTFNSREINSVTMYFTTEYSIGSSEEFKPVPMGAYRNYKHSWGINSFKKENTSGYDNCYVAIIDGWDQKAYINLRDLLQTEVIDQSTTINFRFKIDGYCDYEGTEKDRRLKEGTIVINKQIMVYNCDYIVGRITTDSSVTPNIGTELTPIYGVYNSLADNNKLIKISSEQISHTPNIPNEKFEYRIYDANLGSYSSLTTDWGTYNATMKLMDFKFDSQNSQGEIKKVFRVYVNDNFECKSNELVFQSVAPVSLPGFDSDELIYVCPSSQVFVPGMELDCNIDGVLKIDGNKIESVDNSVIHDESLYGVSYGWEYYTSKNPRKIIQIKSSDTLSPNLCIPESMIEEGTRYCFRQFAVMNKFDGIKVYSNATIKNVNVASYAPLRNELFSLPEFASICSGMVYDDTLKVNFIPESGEVYSSVRSDKKNQFSYVVESDIASLNGQFIASDLSVPFYEKLLDSKSISIEVKDGCNQSINIDKSLIVNQNPVLLKEDISVMGATITNTTDGVTDEIKVSSQGNFTLFIEDSEPNVRYYIYYLTDQKDSKGNYIWDSGKPVGSNGHLISSSVKDKKWYKENISRGIKLVKEDNKRITNCESSPIYVTVSYKGSLYNNIISFSQINPNRVDTIHYLCENEGSPSIIGSEVMGGYGVEGSYSYQWQYSNDSQTWMNMLSSDGKFIITESLEESQWKKPAHTTYYIRRKCYSHIDKNDSESYIFGESNVLRISPMSIPQFKVKVNSESKHSLDVCYNNSIELSVLIENESILRDQGILDLEASYFYVDEKNDTTEIPQLSLSNFMVTDTILIGAYINYCGEKIYSYNSVLVRPYDDLSKDLSVVYGDCMVRGERVSIHINSPKYKEDNYGFVFSRQDQSRMDTVIGTSCDKLELPMNGSKAYSIFVRSERGCLQEKEFRIDNSQMSNPLGHSKLVVEMQNSRGSKVVDDTFFVCASSPLTISDEIMQEADPSITYVWNINNGANINKSYSSLVSSGTHFSRAQQLYRVVRTTSDLNNCRRVEDTIYIKTLGVLEGVDLDLSKQSICHGEEVDFSVKVKGGSGEYQYEWSLGGSPISSDDSLMSSVHLDAVYSSGEQEVKVRVLDKNCVHSAAYSVTESNYLTVEKELSFKVHSVPSFVEEGDIIGGKRKEVLLTLHPILLEDKIQLGDSLIVNGIPTIFDGTLNIQLDSLDFVNHLATLPITRYGKNRQCFSSGTIAIPLSDGFDGMPIVESDLTGILPVEVCAGEKVTLSLSSLPHYNNQSLDTKSISYVWYRGNSQNQWANVGDSAKITISANSGTTDKYYAKLTYTIDGREVSVSSNIYEVTGKSAINVGSIFFAEGNQKTIHYVCRGSVGELTMKLDTITKEKASSYQWYQMIAGSNSWQKVTEEGATVGTNSPECTIDLDNYHSSTMFRLGVVDKCTGEEYFSRNFIWLKYDEGVHLDARDIMLSSALIYDNEVGLPSIRLAVRNDYQSSYYWTKDSELIKDWTEGNPKIIEGPFKGKSTIYLYKQSNEKGNCFSDTIAYTFTSYSRLLADPLFINNSSPVCKSDERAFTFSLNSIVGGDGKYEVEWYYKSDNMGGFLLLDTLNIDTTLFHYEGSTISYGTLGATAQIKLSHLTATTEFYALVRSVGEYQGAPYLTNTIRKEVFKPLQDIGIDNLGEIELCYGDEVGFIKGSPASGGSGEYIYQWQINSLNSEGVLVGWEDIPMAEHQNFNLRYPMYAGGKIRRLVSDRNCRTSLFPKQELMVRVNEEIKITSDDVGFTSYVENGASANMWGKLQNFSYVWYDENNIPCDTTVWTENFITPAIMNSPTLYYGALLAKNGCFSSNRDTILISTYMVDGGHLTFDNQHNSDSDYWICSGQSAGKISCDGIEDTLNGHSYEWYYRVNDSNESNKSLGVYTFDIDLDRCKLEQTLFTNSSLGGTLEKKVSFYRITRFNVNNNGVMVTKSISSDTISLYVVPTLSLVESKMWEGESLAGELMIEDGNNFCFGESVKVKVNVSDSLYKYWESGYYGPKEYDRYSAHYSTWVEYLPSNKISQGGWIIDDKSYLENDAIGAWMLQDLSTNYYVQFAFSDGCSTTYSDYVRVALSNRVADTSEINMFAVTPEGEKITNGFEYGDSLVIKYGDYLYDCYWFGNSMLTDTLSQGGYSYGAIISDHTPNEIYLTRYDEDKGCMSQKIALQLPIYTKSEGGKVAYIGETLLCKGEKFNEIVNVKAASGVMISPNFGEERVFSYQWQFSTDGVGKIWKDISFATDLNLSAEIVNSVISEKCSSYMFRRKAVNESGRICFSDTITLSFYEDFLPGAIHSSSTKSSFCITDSLPTLFSSSPKGGTCGVDGVGYLYKWQYSINGKDFIDLQSYTRYGSTIDLDLLLRSNSVLDLDFSTTHHLSFRAVYKDGYSGCGEVFSKEVSVKIWEEPSAPNIFQDNEDCDANEVLVRVQDEGDYTYSWYMLDQDGNLRWASVVADSMEIKRVSDIVEVTSYGVRAESNISGCPSPITYFDVDSLPQLSQENIHPINQPICFSSDLNLLGGKVLGGNGSKEFEWQYSYDGKLFEPCSFEENLSLKNIKSNTYIRRIVRDVCSSDTSNIVEVKVNKELVFDNKDLFILSDYKCRNQNFNISIKPSNFDSLFSVYANLGFHSISIEIYDNEKMCGLFSNVKNSITLGGFPEESKTFELLLVAIDSLGNRCESEPLELVAYTALPLEETRNTIVCEETSPCNSDVVHIEGDFPSNSDDVKHIYFTWFQSDDNISWSQILLQHEKDLFLKIEDTVFIKRRVTNGCDTLWSNVLSFVGQPLVDVDYVNELSLEVVTQLTDIQDSVILYVRNKEISAGYEFVGDGDLPLLVYGSQTLPYTASAYKDSLLRIRKIGDCYSSYTISPLRGGRIHCDESIEVCKGEKMPSFVVTNVEGGVGEYTFQWQYRNDYFSKPEYVNIEGATGKEYQPESIDVKTWYRRVTRSGEYVLYSNEVEVSIQDEPKVGIIFVEQDSSYFTSRGLEISQFYLQKTEDLPVMLMANVSNATKAYWEYSKDNEKWEMLSSPIDLKTDSIMTIQIKDSFEVRYYRLVAENKCGFDYSEAFKVVTLNDVPAILKEHIQLIKKALCVGDECQISVGDYLNYSGLPACSGTYAYRIRGYDNIYLHLKKYVEGELIRPIGDLILTLKNVSHPIDLVVERVSEKTGIVSTLTYQLDFELFEADFEFSVLTQNKEIKHAASTENVEIEQGALVKFFNVTQQKVQSVSWLLIDSKDYDEGENVDLSAKGLYSYKDSPLSYFYNGGRYSVTMYAVSEHGCRDTVQSSALYIPWESVRTSNVGVGFIMEDEEILDEWIRQHSISEIQVYPVIFDSWLRIDFPKSSFRYRLYNEGGTMMEEGNGESFVHLQLDYLNSGYYILEVNESRFKLLKRDK